MFNLQGGKAHLKELGENVGDLGKSLDLGVATEVGHVFDRLQIIMQFKAKSSEIKKNGTCILIMVLTSSHRSSIASIDCWQRSGKWGKNLSRNKRGHLHVLSSFPKSQMKTKSHLPMNCELSLLH